MLTPFKSRSENIIVEAIIVPELELRNVKMQVFLLTLWKVPTITRLKIPVHATLAQAKIWPRGQW